jgi:hypothetical protein
MFHSAFFSHPVIVLPFIEAGSYCPLCGPSMKASEGKKAWMEITSLAINGNTILKWTSNGT